MSILKNLFSFFAFKNNVKNIPPKHINIIIAKISIKNNIKNKSLFFGLFIIINLSFLYPSRAIAFIFV